MIHVGVGLADVGLEVVHKHTAVSLYIAFSGVYILFDAVIPDLDLIYGCCRKEDDFCETSMWEGSITDASDDLVSPLDNR